MEQLKRERICPICKKEFLPAPEHAYDIILKGGGGRKLVCSYHCMRQWEREYFSKKSKSKKKEIK